MADYTEDDPRLVAIYDDLNGGRWDHDFYFSQLPKSPQYVADIGCGTGAFAVRLAEAGHRVIGLDPSNAMLDFARNRPGADAVSWLSGTAKELPDGPFDSAVMMGHAFQCLISDAAILETLCAISSRLTAQGKFMFESRNPSAKAWLGWNSAEDSPSVSDTSAGRVEEQYSVFSVDNELVDFGCRTKFDSDGAEIVEHVTLRFISAARLAELLEEAGFARVDWVGDWDGSPYLADSSKEMIVLAYKS